MPSLRISVLLPVYNGGLTIGQAVLSLSRQTHADFEVVAVDDGSTDQSGAVLDRLAQNDSRIRVIHLPHAGLIPALNAGLAECRGEFIARMDADDVCHPERLSLQLSHMLDHPEISVCGCLVRSFPRGLVKAGFVHYETWLNSLVTHEEIARDIFIESPLAHPSVMMRARDLRQLGGYRDMGWPEDYDLWLRFHTAGKRFGKVPRVLLFWREHNTRLTFTDSRYSLENFLRLKAHVLAQVLSPMDRPIIVWGTGMAGRRLTKHLVREGVRLVAAVDVDPRKVGRTLRGAPIMAPQDLIHHPNAFVVQAVSSAEARSIIRTQLMGFGRVEGRDFLCAS